MIETIDRVGEQVIQKVCKPDGTLLRYQYGKPGDASGINSASSLEEAKAAIAPLIAKTVDRNGDLVVQKVTKNGKLVYYQYGKDGYPETMSECNTLAAAREAIGKKSK